MFRFEVGNRFLLENYLRWYDFIPIISEKINKKWKFKFIEQTKLSLKSVFSCFIPYYKFFTINYLTGNLQSLFFQSVFENYYPIGNNRFYSVYFAPTTVLVDLYLSIFRRLLWHHVASSCVSNCVTLSVRLFLYFRILKLMSWRIKSKERFFPNCKV